MTFFGSVPGCPGFGVVTGVRGLPGWVLVRRPELPLFPQGRKYLGQGRLPRILFLGLGDPRWIPVSLSRGLLATSGVDWGRNLMSRS